MKRIQRQRTRGWRMPEGAVYVGRPSRWGNDYKVGECFDCWYDGPHEPTHRAATIEEVLHEYRVLIEVTVDFIDSRFLQPLRGHDLACWCALDVPCHADVLLELAS